MNIVWPSYKQILDHVFGYNHKYPGINLDEKEWLDIPCAYIQDTTGIDDLAYIIEEHGHNIEIPIYSKEGDMSYITGLALRFDPITPELLIKEEDLIQFQHSYPEVEYHIVN